MADLMDAVLANNKQQMDNIDQWGQLYDNAKVADMMVKANPDMVQRMGFQTPEQFQTLSAQDKIAATSGLIKNQGVQEFQARMNDYNAQAQQRQQQAMDASAEGDSLTKYASLLDQQVNQPDPNDPKATAFAASVPDAVKFQIHSAAGMGKTNPKLAAAMIKPMMQFFGPQGQGQAQAPQPKMTVLPVGNPGDPDYHEIPVIQDGKGNMQVDPAYTEAQKTKSAAAAQAGKSTMKFKAIPSLTDPSGFATSVEAETPEDLQRGMDLLKKAQTPATPDADAYKSKDDVVAAYKAGKLSRDAAGKILVSKFNVPAQ